MEKNTIIAVVLSVIVITIGMTLQTMFYPVQPVATTEAANTDQGDAAVDATSLSTSTNVVVPSNLAYGSGVNGSFMPINDKDADSTPFTYQTGVFTITFDPKGASVSSIKLKEHTTNGEPVELLFKGNMDKNAFLMYAGNDKTTPIDATFNHTIDGNKVIFTQSFIIKGNSDPFTITKTYTFGEDDYLFEINIAIDNSVNKAIPLSFENDAYTFAFEPQIGPAFDKMPQDQYEYRHFYLKKDGAKKKTQINLKNGRYTSDSTISWVALAGKYFSVIAIPDATNYDLTLTQIANTEEGVSLTSSIYLTRPAVKSAHTSDTFRFYIGPQLKKDMTIYNNAEDNNFGVSGLNLEMALDSSTALGWLESFLMWILNIFYKIIPNYGIGIILVTFLLKFILYPLTKASMSSTAKMSELGPQMQEIKDKYPDNPQKQNELMAALYKKEKINPMGGCLPMLIQFPILIAFFGLLNKHFELRGAMFIPGWISDLSQPDTVLTFGFHIPLLGNQLHILPLLYTVSMIYSMKITQNTQSSGQQQGMMKFMTYGMPLIFFFWLYNSPSGLMLYWSVLNAISIVQQLITNRKQAEKDAAKVTTSKVKQFPGAHKKN
jgi:YidC/Oxa1 family membrane protein insertase